MNALNITFDLHRNKIQLLDFDYVTNNFYLNLNFISCNKAFLNYKFNFVDTVFSFFFLSFLNDFLVDTFSWRFICKVR